MGTLRWVFISIGFFGAILTIVISVINFFKIKKHKVNNVSLLTQIIILMSNIAMFCYGFGLSMINTETIIFYNSMPTWIGNGVAFIVNGALTIVIYYLRKSKKINVENASIV